MFISDLRGMDVTMLSMSKNRGRSQCAKTAQKIFFECSPAIFRPISNFTVLRPATYPLVI